MPFSKQGSRHTGRNLANSKNGTPPPPLPVAPSVSPAAPQREGLGGEIYRGRQTEASEGKTLQPN